MYPPTIVLWEFFVQTLSGSKVAGGERFYYGVVRAPHTNWATFSYHFPGFWDLEIFDCPPTGQLPSTRQSTSTSNSRRPLPLAVADEPAVGVIVVDAPDSSRSLVDPTDDG